MANSNNNIKMGLVVIMGILGLGLMIYAVVNPTEENKAAVMKTAQAPIAPGARK